MKDYLLKIIHNRKLYDGTYEMQLQVNEQLPEIKAGQFMQIETGRADTILRRPICICDINKDIITIIYSVIGKGTAFLALKAKNDTIKAILPLGNGFCLDDNISKVVLIGGGVGVAPLAMVPNKYPNKQYYNFLGFNSAEKVILQSRFQQAGKTVISTDDGSYGFKGYPTQALENEIEKISPDVILTCGSIPLLKQVAKISLKYGVKAYMSGETRMGCGVGACLVCACKITTKDGVSTNQRACVEGPVFDLSEIQL